MKKIYIELTDEQKKKLFPLFDKVSSEYAAGKPGMLLAQIHFTGRDAVAVCGFVKKEVAEKLSVVMSGKKPKIVSDKSVIRALKKARA